MKLSCSWLTWVLIIICLTMLLLGCGSVSSTVTLLTPTPDPSTPVPGQVVAVVSIALAPYPDPSNAQATIDTGQAQLLDLGRQATKVSMERTQTAHAAAQSTQDFNQRQQVDLDYQATVISLRITQAAATQEVFARQTQTVLEAAAVEQRRADEATQSAMRANAAQTAQVIANHNAEATSAQASRIANAREAAFAAATQTAYPMTATPLASTRAAILLMQYDREQQSFTDKIVAPLIPFIAFLNFVLLASGLVWVYLKLWPRLRARRLPKVHIIDSPRRLMLIDAAAEVPDAWIGRVVPHEMRSDSSNDAPSSALAPQVEIIDAAEPPVAQWIAEVEDQLATGGEVTL